MMSHAPSLTPSLPLSLGVALPTLGAPLVHSGGLAELRGAGGDAAGVGAVFVAAVAATAKEEALAAGAGE